MEPLLPGLTDFFISIRILYHLYTKVYKSGSPGCCVPPVAKTRIKRIRGTKTAEHITQPTMKPAKEQVKCPKCDKFCASGAGLASHQRHKHPNIY